MSLGLNVFMNESDVKDFTAYTDGMSRKASRAELLPIMKKHFEPVVAAEKAVLSGHSKSGALATSLSARSGPGDKAGTMSVFSAPTATHKQLSKTWGVGSGQQKKWYGKLDKKKGRKRIFYGAIVHQGHRIVRRNSRGELYDTGKKTTAIPFAKQAMDSKGDRQVELAAGAMLDHILGKE